MNTVNEVARARGVTPQAIYKHIRKQTDLGRKFYHVPGKGYRIDSKDLQEVQRG